MLTLVRYRNYVQWAQKSKIKIETIRRNAMLSLLFARISYAKSHIRLLFNSIKMNAATATATVTFHSNLCFSTQFSYVLRSSYSRRSKSYFQNGKNQKWLDFTVKWQSRTRTSEPANERANVQSSAQRSGFVKINIIYLHSHQHWWNHYHLSLEFLAKMIVFAWESERARLWVRIFIHFLLP